jgi:hypothetical protein
MSTGGGAPYRLIMNGVMRDHLRNLRARAVSVGNLHQFTQTMLAIEAALQSTPTTWGDPLNVLRHMRFTRYHWVLDRLRVIYAVHMDQPTVWLTNVIPLRRHTLWIGEG